MTKTGLLQEPLRIEIIRILLRLSKDRQAISIKKYAYITGEFDELGRMTGGWLKAQSGKDIQKPLA
ncbi:MAG: four helix bundle protein [Nitrospirae bacterium]|nr:MAG: four helix bundle protein [Nitrospirota bacterium]